MREVILQKINKDTVKEFEEILNTGKLEKYESMLTNELEKSIPNIKKLFEKGVGALPQNSARPDFSLATYFFCLSELNGIPDDARSFAMDAMVYCETDMYDTIDSLEKLKKNYKKEIEDTLT